MIYGIRIASRELPEECGDTPIRIGMELGYEGPKAWAAGWEICGAALPGCVVRNWEA